MQANCIRSLVVSVPTLHKGRMEKTASTHRRDRPRRGRVDDGPGTAMRKSPTRAKAKAKPVSTSAAVQLPAALLRMAQREIVDPAALAGWLLEVMDASTLRESARIFKNLH